MPDIFKLYEDAQKKQASPQQGTPDPVGQTTAQIIQQDAEKQDALQGKTKDELINQPDNIASSEEERKANENRQMSASNLGASQVGANRELEAAQNSWTPEYAARGFLEETGVSFARGVGKHFFEGTGDMIQVASSIFPGQNITEGNTFSKYLQEEGQKMAALNNTYIPEELKHENLDFKSVLNPKFWSIHMAEMVPQLIEFVALSKGGAAVGRQVAKGVAKGALKAGVKGATRTALKGEVFGSGSKIVGKLLTDQGLTQGSKFAAGAIGGGLTSNLLSGMLNSAQLVNDYKTELDSEGNRVWSDEQLSDLAASTMVNNSAWLAIDIASFGMTFGGGWKQAGKLAGKGRKMLSPTKQAALQGKKFQREIAPLMSNVMKLSGKVAFEGVEESFQETFEEWAQKKAVAEMKGDPNDSILDKGFLDFMMSKENRGTLVISAAMGALGGGVFNAGTLIDQKAEENFKLYSRIENFKKLTERQGSDQFNDLQEMHIREQIADIVIDENTGRDVYDNFMAKLVANKNRSQEEVDSYESLFEYFESVKSKGQKLNVKGMKALMQNAAVEKYSADQIATYQAESEERILEFKDILNSPTSSDRQIEQAEQSIVNEEELFKKQLYSLSNIQMQAQRNKMSLMLGKKANPLKVTTQLDKYGNEFIVGLSEKQYNEFTKKGESIPKSKKFDISNFGTKTKAILDKITAPFLKKKETVDEEAEPVQSETEEEINERAAAVILSQDQLDEVNSANPNVTATVDENGNISIGANEFLQEGEIEKAQADIAAKQKEVYVNSKSKTKSPSGEVNADNLIDDAVIDDANEVIDEEIYNEFLDKNIVSRDVLSGIADSIMKEGTLSNRQEDIRVKNEDAVKQIIVEKLLKSEGLIKENTGQDIATEVEEDIVDDIADEDVSENEKEFIDETSNEAKRITAEEARKKSEEEAIKKVKFKKKNIKNSDQALDFRDKNEASKIFEKDLADYVKERKALRKVRNHKLYNSEHISKSQLENYINSFSMYNEHGPLDIDRMAVVNHALKKMFPDIESRPAQVIIVQNMYKSLGTTALGQSLGATVFVNSNAWEQDAIYMHELSHIYFKLARHTPEVQAIVDMALADSDLIADIKAKYPDYAIYSHEVDGEIEQVSYNEIAERFESIGIPSQDISSYIEKAVKDGDITPLPLREQRYWIEEMFTKTLEGPLSNNFDKLFNTKEPKRQLVAKKFWGLVKVYGQNLDTENNVEKLVRKMGIEGSGDLKDLIHDAFKNVTQGIALDGLSMDSRANAVDKKIAEQLDSIGKRMSLRDPNSPITTFYVPKEQGETISDHQDDLEQNGVPTFDTDFEQQIKGATRILKRFGAVYNKALRTSFLRANKNNTNVDWNKQRLFDKPLFESMVYNLAKENRDSREFVRQIENSEIQEIHDFNRYLDKVYPDVDKVQILAGIHHVFQNSKHINGFKSYLTYDKSGNAKHILDTSLAQREKSKSDNVIAKMESMKGTPEWASFVESVEAIRNNIGKKGDFLRVIKMITSEDFHLDKVLNKGVATYKGKSFPIETLVSGFIKKGLMDYTSRNGNTTVSSFSARPLVEAMIATDRQFTNYSTILNAQGNQEQVRIANNHLINEVDNIINFLQPNEDGETPTREEFIRRFSHMGSDREFKKSYTAESPKKLKEIYEAINPNGSRITSKKRFSENNPQLDKETVDSIYDYLSKAKRGERPTGEEFYNEFNNKVFAIKKNPKYVPNLFLKSIYDNFEKNGQVPTISQYHGLANNRDSNGSVYKDSSALEQGIEDMLTFLNSSTSEKNGQRVDSYLANVGTFADSPRKFFMSVNRVKYEDIFGKTKRPDGQFYKNTEVLDSFYHTAKKIFNPDNDKNSDYYEMLRNRGTFVKSIQDAVRAEVAFMNENAKELSKIKEMRKYISNGKLNPEGVKMIAEYVVNSSMHGINMAEVFLPGVKGKDIVKRMKANSSPIFSVKNPNFKIETIFVADEVVDGGIEGTDSGMYILRSDAEKFQLLGKGVMEMNDGFKFLNHHVEKENKNFKGKSAYLKGYTTIVDEGHWAYPILVNRKEKFREFFGGEESKDLNDQTVNHVAIIVPQSSDKSNFVNNAFMDGNDVLTEKGERFTPSALKQNYDELIQDQDDLYYDEKGNFVGLETYNFGPQQVMDKIVTKSNTPVQMINSILVNAVATGNLDKAIEIQQHISNQKMVELQKIRKALASGDISDYKKIIMKGLNKEEMDQVQRVLLESGASIANPAVNQIIVNQLAKTILRAGNKLATDGTLAHQKPDTGYNLGNSKVISVKTLQGYGRSSDGGLTPAHMIAPKHMSGTLRGREEMTIYNNTGQNAIHNWKVGMAKPGPNVDAKTESLNAIQVAALQMARKRFKVTTDEEARKHIGPVVNDQNIQTGWYVKGDTVIASRVPGHGPSSTGIYEIVGFDNSTDGNQVMIAGAMNKITGADNDGDSLFIQTKGDNKYGEWNKAFDKIVDHWLSPEMKGQVTTEMNFKKEAFEIAEEIKENFQVENKKHLMFSPSFRRTDYNNTMVSKRSIGKIFNLHKMGNMLAAYKININPNAGSISINNKDLTGFRDYGNGETSRNQRSAILANIILDNTKYGFADTFGFDESNMAQATLLVNMGVSLRDTAFILNSPAAKAWSDVARNSNSMYHNNIKKGDMLRKVYERVGLDYDKASPSNAITLDVDNVKKESSQESIIKLMDRLDVINNEVQKVSGIMSGHNKIHVNPFVLEQQLSDFESVVNNSDQDQILNFTEEFKNNPDLKQYEEVARETLIHTQRINPVYRASNKKVLETLIKKFGGELSASQIETISEDLNLFNSSRLIGLNNVSKEKAKALISQDNTNPESIYSKLRKYITELQKDGTINEENKMDSVTSFENSMLFRRGLSMNLNNRNLYVSANPNLTNESFTSEERERMQAEFAELPPELQDDLMLYDLIENGWKGPKTISPFFAKGATDMINLMADDQQNKKVTSAEKISDVVLSQLEQIIALKYAGGSRNPMKIIDLNKNKNFTSIPNVIAQNSDLISGLIINGEGRYVTVKHQGESHLFEFPDLTKTEILELKNMNRSMRKAAASKLIRKKIKFIPPQGSSHSLNVATISDNNVFEPFKNEFDKTERKNMEMLTEATISYEDAMRRYRDQVKNAKSKIAPVQAMDAREDFDIPLFTKQEPLSQGQYERAMEFKDVVSKNTRNNMYSQYLKDKQQANSEAAKVLNGIESKTEDELNAIYQKYGEGDVYANSIILTPVIKELANKLSASQNELWKKTGRKGKGFDGKDVTKIQAYLMTGSTIPSNHPAAQALARTLEVEYKKFMEEKHKYMSEMNSITEKLYQDKLGYGAGKYRNLFKKIRDMIFVGKSGVYDKLYGNMVERAETIDPVTKKISYDFKLKPKAEIEKGFQDGTISKAEKDFYDYFVKTTDELKPAKVSNKLKENYIPHTAMGRLEMLSARGLLGLMVNSKHKDDAVYDVRMKYKVDGEERTVPFKIIEDMFKAESANGKSNDFQKMLEYRKIKRKALKLLEDGINEDGTPIQYGNVGIETALGFGPLNRFTNNRSLKAEELPSMDLNKALGDYIHSTLFVNGNEKFKGFEKLTPYIDGVLAFNRENNLENLNQHIQTVWKDYFLRGRRQESFLGPTVDKAIRMLTNLNLFYSLGYMANKNTGGLYVVGNILAGKYHNIKDIGGKKWLEGELKYWGLDNGFKGGIPNVIARHKRMQKILKNLNFMEMNIYDEVEMERKSGLDAIMSDIALMPMTKSEEWIQRVHMIGMLSEEELNRFDEAGNYKEGEVEIMKEKLVAIEDRIKASHGRGYQPTDQRAIQMYSWGNMMMQFSKFLPSMIQDRFAQKDVNIYGQEHIGSLRQVSDMVKYVVNNPGKYKEYRSKLSPELRQRLDSGMKGMAMSAVIGSVGVAVASDTANELYGDANYYFNHGKLSGKFVPPAIQSTKSLINGLF